MSKELKEKELNEASGAGSTYEAWIQAMDYNDCLVGGNYHVGDSYSRDGAIAIASSKAKERLANYPEYKCYKYVIWVGPYTSGQPGYIYR